MSIQTEINRINSSVAAAYTAAAEKGASMPATQNVDNLADTVRTISSGVELNFEIVGGTTQPTSASENTIWINTDTAITGWEYSTTQPTGTQGMVWIATGTSATTPFNVLKNNNITVYPLKCYQYVSGAWVEKEAKTYQNGAWVDWATLLFDRTIQTYESIYDGLRCTDGNKSPDSTSAPVTDAFPFVKMTEGSKSTVHRAWQWEAPINFTDYKTLEVYGYSTDGLFAIDDYLLGVGDVYDMGEIAKQNFAKTESLHTMDISGVNTVGYIGFLSRNSNASTYVKYVRLLR